MSNFHLCARRCLYTALTFSLVWTLTAHAQLKRPIWMDGFVDAFAVDTGEPVSCPVYQGTKSMKIGSGVSSGFSKDTYDFAVGARVNSIPYKYLEFYINGGSKGGQTYLLYGLQTLFSNNTVAGAVALDSYLFDLKGHPITKIPAQAWAKVRVPLADLGFADGQLFLAFVLQGCAPDYKTTVAQADGYLDAVSLLGADPAPSAAVTVDFTALKANPYTGMSPGVDIASWAMNADMADPAAANNLMREAGLQSFRAHLSNAAGNYDVGAWDFTADDNNANLVATFGNLIAGLSDTNAFLSYNQYLGSSQQAAALLAYCNVATTDPAYVNDLPIGSATEWYLVSPILGGTPSPQFAQHVRDWKTVRYWVDLRQAQPLPVDDGLNHLRVGRVQPWRFKYWELGNEPAATFINAVPDQHDAQKVALRFVADWKVLKAIDPTIKLGICVVPDSVSGGVPRVAVDNPATPKVEHYTGWTPVVLRTLRNNGVIPDWLSDHIFNFGTNNAEALTANLMDGEENVADRAGVYRRFIEDYFNNFSPAARQAVEVQATECNNPSLDYRFTTSLASGLLLADTMAHFMQSSYQSTLWFTWKSGIANVANSSDPYAGSTHWRDYGDWGIIGSGTSLVSANGAPTGAPAMQPSYFAGLRFPNFFAFKLIHQFAQSGDRIVKSSGIRSDNIYLSTYAVKKANGGVSLLVINKSSSTAIEATFSLTGVLTGEDATVYRFGKEQDNAQKSDTVETGTTVDLEESSAKVPGPTWSQSFPPFSMTVLQLSPK